MEQQKPPTAGLQTVAAQQLNRTHTTRLAADAPSARLMPKQPQTATSSTAKSCKQPATVDCWTTAPGCIDVVSMAIPGLAAPMAKGLVKGADKVADVGKGLKNKGFDNDNLGKYSIIESPKMRGLARTQHIINVRKFFRRI